jgi:hypothetical protein
MCRVHADTIDDDVAGPAGREDETGKAAAALVEALKRLDATVRNGT